MSKSSDNLCRTGTKQEVILCPSYCCGNSTYQFCCSECSRSVSNTWCYTENYFGIVAGCLFGLLVVVIIILSVLSCLSRCEVMRRRFPWLRTRQQVENTTVEIPPQPTSFPLDSIVKPPSYSDCVTQPPDFDEPYDIMPGSQDAREPPPGLPDEYPRPCVHVGLPEYPPDYEANDDIFSTSGSTNTICGSTTHSHCALSNPGFQE